MLSHKNEPKSQRVRLHPKAAKNELARQAVISQKTYKPKFDPPKDNGIDALAMMNKLNEFDNNMEKEQKSIIYI